MAHVWSMQGSWRVTTAGALQDKTSSLARQLARDSNSWLVPVVRLSSQNALFDENQFFTFLIHTITNTLIPMKCRELFRENFERETLEKNKIDSSTIFILGFSKFLYSHPFHCYILERYTLPNHFLTIPISVRRLFGAWEVVRKGPIDIGWFYGL